jgi:hypothetical protein
MLFSDEFIASLQDDPVNGTLALCDKTFVALGLDGNQQCEPPRVPWRPVGLSQATLTA